MRPRPEQIPMIGDVVCYGGDGDGDGDDDRTPEYDDTGKVIAIDSTTWPASGPLITVRWDSDLEEDVFSWRDGEWRCSADFLLGWPIPVLHYCSRTAHCDGGRHDTGHWPHVTCPDCLRSRP